MAELDTSLLQKQLLDIYQPESVSWWPLASGWWLLIAIALISGFFLGRYFYQKTALKRAALKELKHIELRFKRQQNLNQLTMSLNLLLRRILISSAANFNPGISGTAWLIYLDKTWGKPDFSQGIGKYLTTLPYQSAQHNQIENQADIASKLIQLIRAWTRKNTR